MMIENNHIKQIEGEDRRRWFSDEYFDLIVWEDTNGAIVKFELCYDKEKDEHALTWDRPDNHLHLKVDDGEGRLGRHKMTPVLFADGSFDTRALGAKFNEAGRNIDRNVADFIYSKIISYKNNR